MNDYLKYKIIDILKLHKFIVRMASAANFQIFRGIPSLRMILSLVKSLSLKFFAHT
jgi:hypothetical protein